MNFGNVDTLLKHRMAVKGIIIKMSPTSYDILIFPSIYKKIFITICGN